MHIDTDDDLDKDLNHAQPAREVELAVHFGADLDFPLQYGLPIKTISIACPVTGGLTRPSTPTVTTLLLWSPLKTRSFS
jgi:hypothetical protein